MKSNNNKKMPKAGQAGNGTKPHVRRSTGHCFECQETKHLTKDTTYNEVWCKKHYEERHSIISDFIAHAMYGT